MELRWYLRATDTSGIRPMNIWVAQAVLEEKYACYGHFYSIIAGDDKEYRCRGVLEIVSVSLDCNESNRLSSRTTDATVIMMNPGLSKPVAPQNIRIDLNDVCSMDTELVLACPDRTQFQIMRIMEFKKWQHIRILNLSDLRDPNSGSFYEYFSRVESETERDVHSIFSKERSAELKKKLPQDRPIISAWGVSPKLDALIGKCINGVRGSFIGVKKEGSTNKYYHPLLKGKPMTQKEWLHKVCKELGAN